jgi:ribosomal silencing factor RsfS
MDSKKLAGLCREFADNKKAENIVILDVRELSSVADYFYFDVIVHVMRRDVRERYDLETLWGDAPRLKAGRKSTVNE